MSDDNLSWDVRDPIAFDFAMGTTIIRLLDEGRWDDEGVLLRCAAISLQEAYLRRAQRAAERQERTVVSARSTRPVIAQWTDDGIIRQRKYGDPEFFLCYDDGTEKQCSQEAYETALSSHPERTVEPMQQHTSSCGQGPHHPGPCAP